jgi:hypothetical protein
MGERVCRVDLAAVTGGTRKLTGWDLPPADKVTITEPPTDEQLEVLRGLHTRTSATRGEAS